MPFNKTLNVTWHDHLENMSGLFQNLYESKKLVDVTLSCLEGSLTAHRLVLSACSPYFEKIFYDNPCKHPVLILRGISFYEMQQLLEFMYKGSINIAENDLSSLMQTAADLSIKGLADNVIDYDGKSHYESKGKKVRSKENFRTNEDRNVTQENDSRSDKSGSSKPHFVENDDPNTSQDRGIQFRGKKRIAVHIASRNVRTKYSNQIECENEVIRDNIKVEEEIDITENNQDLSNLIPDVEIHDGEVKSEMEHLNILREETYKLFTSDHVCSYCNKKFRSENDLFCHLRVHLEVKPFSCDFCGSGFTRSSHLARHRRTHTGERPFGCSQCEKSFSRQDKLKLHMRSHEKNYSVPEYKIVIKKPIVDPEGMKKPRGRPRKYPVKVLTTLEKRPRGRPRTVSLNPNLITMKEKRPRGRPRKVSVNTTFQESNPLNTSTNTNIVDENNVKNENFTYVTSMPVETEYKEPEQKEETVVVDCDNAVGLLDSVRQIGECTIQPVAQDNTPIY